MSTTTCNYDHPWNSCPKCGVGICPKHMTEWLNHPPHSPEQPAREGEGWYQLPDENGNFDFYTDSGKRVGRATSMEFLQRIVTDHARAALVPVLLNVLHDAMKVVADKAAGGRMLTTQNEARDVWQKYADVLAAARKARVE